MASNGIRDRVAIVGMGCTRSASTGTRASTTCWSTPRSEALNSASVAARRGRRLLARHALLRPERAHALAPAQDRLQAGEPARELLRHRLRGVPQRVLRGGLRRLRHRDGHRRREAEGLRLLRPPRQRARPATAPRAGLTAPATFSLLAPAYAKKYGVDEAQLKEVMTRIAWKNHKNGALEPARAVPQGSAEGDDRLLAARRRRRSASSTARASATARRPPIIVRAEDAHKYTDKPLYVKALSFIAGPAAGPIDPDYDYTTFPEVVASAATPTPRPASRTRAQELAMAEVHDCFTPDRAGADGGPRLRRARHRVEGSARRHVRPRRRAGR